MAQIPYVCLYRSYYEELENFSPEQRGRLLWALLEYLCTGQEPELPEPERYFWPRLRSQHHRDEVHYNEVCDRNRANGTKGGKVKAERIKKRAEAARSLAGASGNDESDESALFLAGASGNDESDESALFLAVGPKEREKEKEKEREKEKHTITECGVCHFPSKEEVLLFCQEKGLKYVDPERFVDYYSSIGWVISGQPIKDWKAAAKLWNQRERARLGENHGLEESDGSGGFGTVI